MARTFSTAYDNDPKGFQKRVFAELEAQSIAIAAALALAAKGSAQGNENALNIVRVLISELDSKERIFPINDRDKSFAMQHLGDIFVEAEKILKTDFPKE